MAKLNDSSFMPFGKWTGTRMANVPADYLLWLYDNKKCNAEVAEYIKENIDVLKKQVEEEKSKESDWNKAKRSVNERGNRPIDR